MAEIRGMRISGFRGIKTCLDLKFEKNGSAKSMVIYGRNGTGKSSITDAWEWVQTEKIDHLRREGAGPNAYPHKFAQNGESFIEIDFEKSDLGTIRFEYDFSRITKIKVTGNLQAFRKLTPHPCFIRFEDLTRFVLLTKSEKFDSLSRLMGFVPQVEIQKALGRVHREFNDFIDTKKREILDVESRIRNLLSIDILEENIFLHSLNLILKRNQITPANKFIELSQKKMDLNSLVINDPKSILLSQLKSLNSKISIPILQNDLFTLFEKLNTQFSELLLFQNEFSKLVLLDLFEQGKKALTLQNSTGGHIYKVLNEKGFEVDICPLCGQEFDHDLHLHISDELEKLIRIKEARDSVKKIQAELRGVLPKKGYLSLNSSDQGEDSVDLLNEFQINLIISKGKEVEEYLEEFNSFLDFQLAEISQELIENNRKYISEIISTYDEYILIKDEISGKIISKVTNLEKDNEKRRNLVEDNTTFQNCMEFWDELLIKKTNLSNYEKTNFFTKMIIDDFIQSSIKNVQARFEIISDDVKTFFEILEQDTKGLRDAKLMLLADEERAVELQVEFYGEEIYPAYKFLSESQLNSFGLAIFLASAKYFNSDFKFMILDDIINSFDGYKRPKIAYLLKNYFSTHQLVLLTHDNVWFDQLCESFPSSIKKRFSRWELNHGPFDLDGCSPLDEIKQQLEIDKPVIAGGMLGPFLERQLQELCERFEVTIKYNRLNEYTLDPLLDRFRVRSQDKLGKDHNLVVAIQNLHIESGFRNLCSHWKNPAIQLTKEEMQSVVEKWEEIEKIARCQIEGCYQWVRYDDSISGFVCPCGTTKIVRSVV